MNRFNRKIPHTAVSIYKGSDLVWSSDLPKQNGLYWHTSETIGPCVVLVNGLENAEFMGLLFGVSFNPKIIGGFWAGPLKYPSGDTDDVEDDVYDLLE